MKTNHKLLLTIGLYIIALGCLGCLENSNVIKTNIKRSKIEAHYTDEPVVIDGVIDDKIWTKANYYSFNYPKSQKDNVREQGKVMFAWDANYFYLAAELTDSDIIAEKLKDQEHHYRYGDVCELFIKPLEYNYYWELYSTPAGNKTTFFFPSKGHFGLESCFSNYTSGLETASKISGTLNNWTDKDNCWTTEMAIPVKDLVQYGNSFGVGSKWSVLVGRYNFGIYLPSVENSTIPEISILSYHLTDEYAEVIFIK